MFLSVFFLNNKRYAVCNEEENYGRKMELYKGEKVMEFSNELKKATLKTAFHYLEKNPEENIHRIMAAIDKFAGDGPDSFPTQREAFRNVLENPDNNMYQLIMSVLKDIDKEVVKVSLENFFFNANIVGWPIDRKSVV